MSEAALRLSLMKWNEASWQAYIGEIAAIGHWRVMHQRPAMRRDGRWVTAVEGAPGWPDLVLVKPPRALFLELKVAPARPTTAQETWLSALRACGLEALWWQLPPHYSRDWADYIQAVLWQNLRDEPPASGNL